MALLKPEYTFAAAMQHLANPNVGALDLVKALVEASEPLTPADYTKMLEQSRAISTGSQYLPEIVKYLVEQGADIESTQQRGHTMLAQAVGNGRIELVRTLVALGANPNVFYDGKSIMSYDCNHTIRRILMESPMFDPDFVKSTSDWPAEFVTRLEQLRVAKAAAAEAAAAAKAAEAEAAIQARIDAAVAAAVAAALKPAEAAVARSLVVIAEAQAAEAEARRKLEVAQAAFKALFADADTDVVAYFTTK